MKKLRHRSFFSLLRGWELHPGLEVMPTNYGFRRYSKKTLWSGPYLHPSLIARVSTIWPLHLLQYRTGAWLGIANPQKFVGKVSPNLMDVPSSITA